MKLVIIVLGLFIGLWQVQGHLRHSTNEKQKKFFVPPPQNIKQLTFGYHEPMADVLWIRVIQDFSHCDRRDPQWSQQVAQTQLTANLVKENDIVAKEASHLIKVVSEANKGRVPCKMGWVYRMLLGITELAPRFETIYISGATLLSVALDDYEGASVLFEKGTKVFPNSWTIPYRAAYHFMFDRKDLKKGADYLTIAADNGAPPWVRSLASRAYTASGQGMLAISVLSSLLEQTTSEVLRKELRGRIERIQQSLETTK